MVAARTKKFGSTLNLGLSLSLNSRNPFSTNCDVFKVVKLILNLKSSFGTFGSVSLYSLRGEQTCTHGTSRINRFSSGKWMDIACAKLLTRRSSCRMFLYSVRIFCFFKICMVHSSSNASCIFILKTKTPFCKEKSDMPVQLSVVSGIPTRLFVGINSNMAWKRSLYVGWTSVACMAASSEWSLLDISLWSFASAGRLNCSFVCVSSACSFDDKQKRNILNDFWKFTNLTWKQIRISVSLYTDIRICFHVKFMENHLSLFPMIREDSLET